MEEHFVKILDTAYLTHDVVRLTVERPPLYHYTSGQATEVAINKPKWKNERRPFTFTSLDSWPNLEFSIKIYREHQGVTAQIEKLVPGDELILHDVWGTISYKGKGVFIAGGAGITPFISIFRQLEVNNELNGNVLIYSNKSEKDIILRNEFNKLLDRNFYNVLSRENFPGYRYGRLDTEYLKSTIINFNQHFYVCGPEEFTNDIQKMVVDLGATSEAIVIEK